MLTAIEHVLTLKVLRSRSTMCTVQELVVEWERFPRAELARDLSSVISVCRRGIAWQCSEGLLLIGNWYDGSPK